MGVVKFKQLKTKFRIELLIGQAVISTITFGEEQRFSSNR